MDYKSSKESFVSGMTGSTITHVNLISSASLCSLALYHSLRARNSHRTSLGLLLEWLVLVVPLLLSMTLFANKPVILSSLLLLASLVAFYFPENVSKYHPLPNEDEPPRPTSPSHAIDITSEPLLRGSLAPSGVDRRIKITPLPAISTYRSHMMLMTCLAILAVDFPVFPRSLVKCESFGVSLMDLGVGSFVFSQGLVSAIPMLKDPAHLSSPAVPKIIRTIKKALPLLFLGIVRVIMVKGVEYPEHESEYGTHWNFFFTLALLPILQALLHPYITYMPISLLGFLVGLCHQAALSLTSLQSYALNAPRLGLISANKEGLISLTGYLAIHLLGLSIGTVILPPSPSDFRRQQNSLKRNSNNNEQTTKHSQKSSQRQDGKTAIELFSYGVLWWSLFGLCWLMQLGGGVSRRLANLQYILWVVAYNTTFLIGYIVLDIIFYPASPLGDNPRTGARGHDHRLHPVPKRRTTERGTKRQSPALLEAINTNGLVFFLLANVATGLVNISIQTMYASDTAAMLVLSAYSLSCCAAAWMFRTRRLWNI